MGFQNQFEDFEMNLICLHEWECNGVGAPKYRKIMVEIWNNIVNCSKRPIPPKNPQISTQFPIKKFAIPKKPLKIFDLKSLNFLLTLSSEQICWIKGSVSTPLDSNDKKIHQRKKS
jgi:hypothetical protein